MSYIPRKIIIEVPQSIREKYYEALTWKTAEGVIRKSYFNDQGNLELIIPSDKYTVQRQPAPSSIATRFGGDWVQVQNIRYAFSIDVIEEMAELRFTFEELRRYQGSTVHDNKLFRAVRLWDETGFDLADYATGITERWVKIMGIEPQAGSGVQLKGRQNCVNGVVTQIPDNPRRFLGQPFRVSFEEFGHRESS